MAETLYIWEDDHRLFPGENDIFHLDMKKLLAWSPRTEPVEGSKLEVERWDDFPRLRIAVSGRRPLPDHLACGSIRVVSPGGRDLLSEYCSREIIEFHDVRIIHGYFRIRDWFAYNVLAIADPVDYAKSAFDERPDGADHFRSDILWLQAREDFVASAPIFAWSKMQSIIMVTEELRMAMLSRGMNGNIFVPLNGYSRSWVYRKDPDFSQRNPRFEPVPTSFGSGEIAG